MDILNWRLQTNPTQEKRMLVSEYVLNDMGIFIKDEYRMPKNDLLTTITGFRIGYNNIPDTDYHAAPGKRNAILWHKITDLSQEEENCYMIKGNLEDEIRMFIHPEDREQILHYISIKLRQHPPVKEADRTAAGWMCWRDDDEWEDPYGSLLEMIEEEMAVDRFVDDVIEDTVLLSIGNRSMEGYLDTRPSQASVQEEQFESNSMNKRPKFCSKCGVKLSTEGDYCHNCGAPIYFNEGK